MKVAVLGTGRMGRALLSAIGCTAGARVAGAWSRGGDLDGLLRSADVAVDFTLPQATARILETAVRRGTPLVSGVTGLDDESMRRIGTASQSIPLLYDRNMSVGIAVLDELAALAASSLGERFETSIHETHHAHKKDAPSGTALKLGETIARARHQEFRAVRRDFPAPRRTPADILISAERRGEVPGEHTVTFRNDRESLSLRHAVTDRRVFAEGALRAAIWLVGRGPGLYAMRDVVRAATGAGDRGPVTVK